MFLVAREDKPFCVPIVRPAPKLMDLGTGTGIWGITVAEEYAQYARNVSWPQFWLTLLADASRSAR